MTAPSLREQGTLFGHPTGLFTLFFAEMWERFSFYGMRAILVFYMTKGFLGYGDSDAYAVYGAYTALVYMTPFFGGMLADRLFGPRRAVIWGGLLMAAGHLVMTVKEEKTFFLALALIIAGNGFFKPNISSMVGSLYPPGAKKRDGGFILFYMGINLGAALSPLLCGYVGEKYGWHYGFGLATVGMLVGLAVFWMPTRLAQMLILFAALATSAGMVWSQADSHWVPLSIYIVVAGALLAAAFVAFRALGMGGLPEGTGAPPDMERLRRPIFGVPAQYAVMIGTLLVVPVFALLVGTSRGDEDPLFFSKETLEKWSDGSALEKIFGTIAGEVSKPAGLVLSLAGAIALFYLLGQMRKLERIPRDRMRVAMILIFFSVLFWAFFEQAGSSITNFTDRNVDRVLEGSHVTSGDVGQEKTVVLTQEQLGYSIAPMVGVKGELKKLVTATIQAHQTSVRAGTGGEPKKLSFTLKPSDLLSMAGGQTVAVDAFSWLWAPKIARSKSEEADRADMTKERKVEFDTPKKEDLESKAADAMAADVLGSELFTMEKLMAARMRASDRAAGRDAGANPDDAAVKITLTKDHVGMGLGTTSQEIPASTFQTVNPSFILLFGLPFTLLWAFLSARGKEPSAPFKFALGILQLGLGFGALWYAAAHPTDRGMVGMGWLTLGYLLHTTGEICLSPVGLSMMTKLSPARLVSTVMGMWFVATAFANFLAAVIAQFTNVSHGGSKGSVIPPPSETVSVYGGVFGAVAASALVSAVIIFAMVPMLKKWMHEGVEVAES